MLSYSLCRDGSPDTTTEVVIMRQLFRNVTERVNLKSFPPLQVFSCINKVSNPCANFSSGLDPACRDCTCLADCGQATAYPYQLHLSTPNITSVRSFRLATCHLVESQRRQKARRADMIIASSISSNLTSKG